MNIRRVTWAAVYILLFCARSELDVVTAQSSQTPRFDVQADVILVDLIATDREGCFISDLRSEEVEVQERGKRQQGRFFQLQRSAAARALRGGSSTKLELSNSVGENPDSAGAFAMVPLVILLDLVSLAPH